MSVRSTVDMQPNSTRHDAGSNPAGRATSYTLTNVKGADPTDGNSVTIEADTYGYLFAFAGPAADLTEYEFVLLSRTQDRSCWRRSLSGLNGEAR